MTDKIFCEKHPFAPSIANCSKCAMALCGMCATYTDDEVLCEDCTEIRAAEKYVSKQTSQLQRSSKPAHVEPLQTKPDEPAYRKKAGNQQTLQWGVTILASGIIAYQFLFASRTDFVPMDAAAIAQQNAVAPLASCISIFREIGSLLRTNQLPDESLRCDQSGTPNIISREGGDIKISHPHPDFYGYTEIYVSRSNPEPTLIE
ncbi:MAG: hypothetical protein O2971_08465 [Proteobacteria bacterium]|nr:hypothetical protein [Pseudomonadota bacterium]